MIIDVDMPRTSVSETLAGLRHVHTTARIAVTSSRPERDIFSLIPQNHPVSFLRKPYTLGRLRKFLLNTLAPTPPNVICLTGTPDATWRRSVEERLEVTLCDDSGRVVEDAGMGFPNIVLWDVSTIDLDRHTLEVLRQDSIPVAFDGRPDQQENLGYPDDFIASHSPSAWFYEVILRVGLGPHKSQSLLVRM